MEILWRLERKLQDHKRTKVGRRKKWPKREFSGEGQKIDGFEENTEKTRQKKDPEDQDRAQEGQDVADQRYPVARIQEN